MDGFSFHFEPYGISFNDFHDSGDSAVVSVGLTMFPEGLRTLGRCPEGPGPCKNVLRWSDAAAGRSETLRQSPESPGTLCECPAHRVGSSLDLSQLVGTCLDLSGPVATSRSSCGLKGPTARPNT